MYWNGDHHRKPLCPKAHQHTMTVGEQIHSIKLIFCLNLTKTVIFLLQTAAIFFLSKLGVFHGWFNLQGLTKAVRIASWARITKWKKSYPLWDSKPCVFRFGAIALSTALQDLISIKCPPWLKVYRVLLVLLFRKLPVTGGRRSKIIYFSFLSHYLYYFAVWPIKKLADWKEFTKCNYQQIILQHLQRPTGKFLKRTLISHISVTIFGRHDHIWKTCPYMEFWRNLGNNYVENLWYRIHMTVEDMSFH